MYSWVIVIKIKIYRLVICCCVVWVLNLLSVSLIEQHRLRVLGNRVLRRIFGPKREEVTVGWRKLYNEKLHTAPNCRMLSQGGISGCGM